MTALSRMSKLAELRAKTDQDLVRLIGNALEVGIQCASAATHELGPLREKAEDIYADALVLSSKIDGVTERLRLEGRLQQLRALLNQSAVAQTASSSAC
jgi:hypothetical protein